MAPLSIAAIGYMQLEKKTVFFLHVQLFARRFTILFCSTDGNDTRPFVTTGNRDKTLVSVVSKSCSVVLCGIRLMSGGGGVSNGSQNCHNDEV
jgi:hypothetical protein